MPMADWMAGTPATKAGPGDSGSVHVGSAPSDLANSGHLGKAGGLPMSTSADGPSSAAAAAAAGPLSSSVGSHQGLGDGGSGGFAGGNGGMEWMGSEGGLNALSPVSLSGLVQSVEKAAGAGSHGTDQNASGTRNHELDFFSF